jgi:hypothetical protein
MAATLGSRGGSCGVIVDGGEPINRSKAVSGSLTGTLGHLQRMELILSIPVRESAAPVP